MCEQFWSSVLQNNHKKWGNTTNNFQSGSQSTIKIIENLSSNFGVSVWQTKRVMSGLNKTSYNPRRTKQTTTKPLPPPQGNYGVENTEIVWSAFPPTSSAIVANGVLAFDPRGQRPLSRLKRRQVDFRLNPPPSY